MRTLRYRPSFMAKNLPLGPLGFAELPQEAPVQGPISRASVKVDKVDRTEIQVFPSGNFNFRMETN